MMSKKLQFSININAFSNNGTQTNIPLAALEICTSFSSHQKLEIDQENFCV
jgi:hypothetical protein